MVACPSVLLATHPFVDPSGNFVWFYLIGAGYFFANAIMAMPGYFLGYRIDEYLSGNGQEYRVAWVSILSGLVGLLLPTGLTYCLSDSRVFLLPAGIVLALQACIFFGLCKDYARVPM